MSVREGLIIPENYNPDIKYNGCGPDFTQKIPLIRRMLGPDSFFAASCEIHDYQYSFDDNIPASESHRKEADDLFLKNMYREIEARVTNWFHKILRKAQAGIFHQLVRVFGKNHYKRGSKDASGTTD